jgi:hypothetical protein
MKTTLQNTSHMEDQTTFIERKEHLLEPPLAFSQYLPNTSLSTFVEEKEAFNNCNIWCIIPHILGQSLCFLSYKTKSTHQLNNCRLLFKSKI